MQVVLGCWSQHDTEHKLQLFLTDGEQGQSDRNSMASAFSWARPLLTQTADNTVAIDLLLSALLRKNVLTENEVAGIRDEISQRSPEIRYGFFRVDDIDTL
jgi:hypothetical protein